MALSTPARSAVKARSLPIYRDIPSLLRDPLNSFAEWGRQADGEIVRLDAKVCRPYLITAPDHVQHILRGNQANYARGGIFYSPLKDLFGDGILGADDGQTWVHSRRIMQPMFTARHIKLIQSRIAGFVKEGLDALEEPARTGTPVDVEDLMASIVTKAVVGLIFGQRIGREQADELTAATNTLIPSMIPRVVTPFLPEWVPRPKDRVFAEAIRVFDKHMYEVAAAEPQEGDDDLLTLFLGAPGPDGGPPSPKWLRDNFSGVYGAASESTVSAMVWLMPILARHPEVYAKLTAEIDEVIGADEMSPEHLPRLVYTKQVIDELLRYMPVGWLFSRVAVDEDVIDGVRIPRGADILISPFISHRSEKYWDRPLEFDPERFAPGAPAPNRYSYFPFGAGGHLCIGNHLFATEALLLLAGLFSRFRLVNVTPTEPTRVVGATIKPLEKVEMVVRPAR
ncbi:cytochrome P450 [Actinocorallia populi]|uniref:cytochrome P450 n=1 Tax=Actinocorallia populi TaxID=2079200 RepID=UPI002FCDCCB5